MNLIGEIHNKADYSGSHLGNVNIDRLLGAYNRHCTGINVVTEQSLGGDMNILKKVLSDTTLPVCALNFYIDEKYIENISQLGVSKVIVIYAYNKNNINTILELCKTRNIDPIIEVGTLVEAEEVIRNIKNISTIGINTRNIHDLKHKDFEKVKKIAEFIRKKLPKAKIIGESGLDTNHQRISIDTDAWLIGSSIIKSSVPYESVEYFSENNVNLPYIWLRPSAFIGDKKTQISEILEYNHFKLCHTIASDDFLKRFFYLKEKLFYKNPEVGKIFLSAIKDSTAYIDDTLGIDNTYNEVWFLKNQDLTLSESYTKLLKIKQYIRNSEDVAVRDIVVNEENIGVKVHSLHTPDHEDHFTDILKILDNDGKRFQSYDNINRFLL